MQLSAAPLQPIHYWKTKCTHLQWDIHTHTRCRMRAIQQAILPAITRSMAIPTTEAERISRNTHHTTASLGTRTTTRQHTDTFHLKEESSMVIKQGCRWSQRPTAHHARSNQATTLHRVAREARRLTLFSEMNEEWRRLYIRNWSALWIFYPFTIEKAQNILHKYSILKELYVKLYQVISIDLLVMD